ncbi:hypothetical protein HLPCO_002870 [Haloplasma contractile SSD-17B]|uniref:Uncharacterized protein n=1 Tax=Haloplasma contractile SSD-17B TaxID=1033810 RepID=U2FIJ6_9MOLU|nr:hypothetical protein HLPCO_002870 [Haloplasma contractile SSD-17B]
MKPNISSKPLYLNLNIFKIDFPIMKYIKIKNIIDNKMSIGNIIPPPLSILIPVVLYHITLYLT